MASFNISPFELPEELREFFEEECTKAHDAGLKGEWGMVLCQVQYYQEIDEYVFSGKFIESENAQKIFLALNAGEQLEAQKIKLEQDRQLLISNSKNNIETHSGKE